MKNILQVFVLAIIIFSCSEKKENNLVINGTIKGLKKGTLYIQRVQDTLLVALDTIKFNGNSSFTSIIDIKEPEMLYLFLDRGVTNSLDNNVPFFAEQGEVNIETSLEHFTSDTKITGSKNQELYEEYKLVTAKFINQDLELLKSKFLAMKVKNQAEIDSIEVKRNYILKKRYLYTTNFAVNHANYEVAPYVALAEIPDIHLKYLDTINNSLSKNISNSLYGKKLKQLIAERRRNE